MGHGHGEASPWLVRWGHLLPPASAALDVACGHGRHLRWLLAQGHAATGVDRDADALASAPAGAECIRADIEGAPWPLAGRQFQAVLVFNYLWRPLWPQILQSLAPGGVLVYETFAHGQASVGKPSRPDFLLQPGELLQRCAGLCTVAYEDGFLASPDRFVQRIVAIQPGGAGSGLTRHHLAI